MRLLIATGLFPPDIGGPATYVPRIASALARRGHAVSVVAPKERGASSPICDPPYRLVQFHRARTLRYVNFLIELERATAAMIGAARECDLIFVNGLSLASTLAHRIGRKPMVVKVVGDGAWELAHNRGWTHANLDEFQQIRGPRINLFRAMRHAAAREAEVIITPSRYLAGIVEAWGVSTDRIRVVHNAFAIPARTSVELPDPELPPAFDHGFRLMTVGRLVRHKRVADIISVVAELDDVRLIVVGDGPRRQALETQVATMGLGDRVHFTGRLPQARVWSLLARFAQALILNSTYEGFPHILLEAAHFGVPVVATHVGGTPEMVEHGKTGLLVPPDAPQDLLDVLQHLRSHPELRRRLARDARQAVSAFSFERMVEGTERALMEALT